MFYYIGLIYFGGVILNLFVSIFLIINFIIKENKKIGRKWYKLKIEINLSFKEFLFTKEFLDMIFAILGSFIYWIYEWRYDISEKEVF